MATLGTRGGLLRFAPRFVPRGGRAETGFAWTRRDAALRDEDGQILSSRPGVEAPAAWSDTAVAIAAGRYFAGGGPGRSPESSIRDMVDRVTDAIAERAREAACFAGPGDVEAWRQDLRHLLFAQRAAFNSPVWFNIGVAGRAAQAAACFINRAEGSLESILDLLTTQARLYWLGSGSGVNRSAIPSTRERSATGGAGAGPLAVMVALDAMASTARAVGAVRRAASMIVLDADHPDVLEFIRAKAAEERKAQLLVAGGWSPIEAYQTVRFQNANHSVRVTDALMRAVGTGGGWVTRAVTDGAPVERLAARALWREIAAAVWTCGDPGLQFDDALQAANTVPPTGRINATNPCSEFAFLDDTACNLASLNLLAFVDDRGGFDVAALRHAVDVLLTAQDILVSGSSYPTAAIATNSERLRPLGLGFTNLGAAVMALGLPYGSEAARRWAASVAALLTGEAYRHSARMARAMGPFAEFERNRAAMLEVLGRQRQATIELTEDARTSVIVAAARSAWDDALALGATAGFRNAQVTAIAPTGTIGLLMDCDTTGIEPEYSLVKRRRLAGGESLRLVNRTVGRALRALGYTEPERAAIAASLARTGSVASAPELRPRDVEVFQTAAGRGVEALPPLGQLEMVAAVQPFVSGSVAKTLNLPAEAGTDSIAELLLAAWRLGLKAIAVYRDGSKQLQPVSR